MQTANHPLQTDAWALFRKTMGLQVDQSPCGRVYFRNLANFTIGYIPKGPLPNEKSLQELRNLGKKHNAIYILLEPKDVRPINLYASHHPLFTKYTFILDLTKSDSEFLSSMHSKTRYNIKVAQKHGVIIKQDNSEEALKKYLMLSEETTSRQKFYAHNQTYHTTMWNCMHNAGIASLWTATYNNEVLAAWIIFAWKDTIYYPYGASSRKHREVMAPYLLLWEIAKWGKSQGYIKFDLWGALGPNPDPTDPWYGFHKFKEGFHPDLVEFTGSYDLVINPFMYKLFCFADNLRWKVLKFLKK